MFEHSTEIDNVENKDDHGIPLWEVCVIAVAEPTVGKCGLIKQNSS